MSRGYRSPEFNLWNGGEDIQESNSQLNEAWSSSTPSYEKESRGNWKSRLKSSINGYGQNHQTSFHSNQSHNQRDNYQYSKKYEKDRSLDSKQIHKNPKEQNPFMTKA